MKRAAEKQLTKDNAEDDDEQVPEEDGSGFKQADPTALAERRIKGLPKRALGVTTSPIHPTDNGSSSTSSSQSSRFGGFAGFGNNASSSFTFTPSMPPPSRPPAKDSMEKISLDAVVPSTTAMTSNQADRGEDAALTYCLKLRGLNNSFLDAIKKATDEDPLLDMSTMFEQYVKTRKELDREFKKDSPKPKPPQSSFPIFGGSTTSLVTSSSSKPNFSAFTANAPASNSMSLSSTSLLENNSTKPSFTFASTSAESKPSPSLFWKMPSNPDTSVNSSDSPKGPTSDFKSSSLVPLTPGFAAFTAGPPAKTDDSASTSSSSASKLISTGSIGNPVGFGFGSFSNTPTLGPAKWPTTELASKTEASTVSQPDSAEEGSQVTEDAVDTTTSTDANRYDAAAEGEEGETIIFEAKAKAFKMVEKDGKGSWAVVGTGRLKLKAHESGRRRLLMRNSANGKIVLNFNLYPGFKTSYLSAKSFTFRVPGEGDSAAVFSMKTTEEATKWQKALQDEVDALTTHTA